MAAPTVARNESVSELLTQGAEALRADRVADAHRLYTRALEETAAGSYRGEALEGLGLVAHASGRPREAVQLLEQALKLLGTTVAERPAVAEALGRSYAETGDLDRATIVFEACRGRFREEGDRINEVRFACLLGYALTDRGKFAEAEQVLTATLAAGEGIDDPLIRARLCWAEARLRGERGQTEIAAERAQEALEILRTTDEQQWLALTHELLASLYIDLGRAEEALALLREGWPLLINHATPLQAAHYRIEEARALAALGERDGAAAVAMRVAAQLDGTHPGDAGRAYVLLGEIFADLGDVTRARQLYESGIALLREQGPSRYLASAYKRLGELFETAYRTEDAVGVLARALAIQEGVEAFDAPLLDELPPTLDAA
jgi:tetratricopeptide (TPR) repeat protein